jgi:hypothetical protein
MNIKEIRFNDAGQVVALNGTFKRSKHFSLITDKVIYWAELGIEYKGG